MAIWGGGGGGHGEKSLVGERRGGEDAIPWQTRISHVSSLPSSGLHTATLLHPPPFYPPSKQYERAMLSSCLNTSNARFISTTTRLVRAFSAQNASLEKPLPPRFKINESDITESFLKGTGPGGQKINKTSSAVQLKHLPTGIVVKSQETRSREQNRKTARRILAEKLEDMEKGPLSRTAIKAERARKKKASASKKTKRKYRKLDDDKAADSDQEDQESNPRHLDEEDTSNPDDISIDADSASRETRPG